jgi:hypothetical protein
VSLDAVRPDDYAVLPARVSAGLQRHHVLTPYRVYRPLGVRLHHEHLAHLVLVRVPERSSTTTESLSRSFSKLKKTIRPVVSVLPTRCPAR